MNATKSSERRDGPRIDLRLRVRYEASGVSGEAEASDVSPKGLRLESDKPVDKGTELTLHVDAGELEEMSAVGQVTWCRAHTSPTGKTLYDIGVAFASDWVSRDRGPLGSALARIFAMNSSEPGRSYERTPVSLAANSVSPVAELEVGNLSLGGMQLRSKVPLGSGLKTGLGMRIDMEVAGAIRAIQARVAWVAEERNPPPSARIAGSFGVEFINATEADRRFLEEIRMGRVTPARITIALEM